MVAVGAGLSSTLKCAGTRAVGTPSKAVVLGSNFLSWLCASSLEDPERRLSILLWQSQYFLQTLASFLVSRGMIPQIEGGATIAFSVALGILNYFFHHEPDSGNSTALGLIQAFIGKDRENVRML